MTWTSLLGPLRRKILPRPASRRHRVHLEALEDRCVPSTLTVGAGKQFATIGAAVSAAHNSGDTIDVYNGTYQGQVVLPSRFTSLILEAAKNNQPTIKAPPQNLMGSQALVDINGATGIVLRGFIITGPGHGQFRDLKSGVFVEGGGSATIQNNTITNIQDMTFNGGQEGTAIRVGRSSASGTPTTGTAIITGNVITKYQKDGIDVTNVGSSATISSNTITGVGATGVVAQNGIEFSLGATGSASNNSISKDVYTGPNFTAAGILLYQPGNGVKVSGNDVSTADVGIFVLDAASPTISNNDISGSTYYGIGLDTAGGAGNTGATVSNNNSTNNLGDGISIASTSNSTFSNNNTTGNAANGMTLFFAVVNCTFSNDNGTSNHGNGILVVDSTSTGNHITQCDFTGNTGTDAVDDSHGTGTGGTANTWSGNTIGTKSPGGLQ